MAESKNMAQCLKCGDVIESRYTHEFVWCSCKSIFIDGGLSYFKWGGDIKFFKRLKEKVKE